MRTRSVAVVPFLLLSVLSLAGCISYRSGDLPPIEDWPPAAGDAKRSIRIEVTGRAEANDDAQPVKPAELKAWKDAAAHAYRDSGLFSEVLVDEGSADLVAKVYVLHRGSYSMALVIATVCTVTIIPARGKDEFVVSTTITDRNGRKLGSYEKTAETTTWIQLLLIFGAPFAWPGTVGPEALYDVNRATVVEANGKKVL